MGQIFSGIQFLDAEKVAWLDHTLAYDSAIRDQSLQLKDRFVMGQTLRLGWCDSSYCGFSFKHYFVANDKGWFLEFGAATLNIYDAMVNINNLKHTNFESVEHQDVIMDETVMTRIMHVLGVKNYSLCLRNCEHVARYVLHGRWLSTQMEEGGAVMRAFQNHLLGNDKKKVNTFPASIQPHVFNAGAPQVYSFIEKPYFTPTGFQYYMDREEDTYNIAVFGPSGCGKSHLINVLTNRTLCDSQAGHLSVTKDVYFVKARAQLKTIKFSREKWSSKQKEVVIADTIGLCDSTLSDGQIFSFIKGRIHSSIKHIHQVVIVFSASRLNKSIGDAVKEILKWLKYAEGDNSYRFRFVCTHAEDLSEGDKQRMRSEACEYFGIEPFLMWEGRNKGYNKLRDGRVKRDPHVVKIESITYVGLPKESTRMNDVGRQDVLDSYEKLSFLTLEDSELRPLVLRNDSSDFCCIS